MLNNSSLINIGTVLYEKYRILMPLGQGGFSITYLAETLSDGKTVVVKEFFNSSYMVRTEQGKEVLVKDKAFLSRFNKEKQSFFMEWDILSRFSSLPGIVRPIDFFEANNTVYIIMQHLTGGSLKNNISSKGICDADALLSGMEEVLKLLAEMHKQGLVHGDISPDNLVRDQDGNYKLIDFGAARKTGDNAVANDFLRKEGYTAAEVFNRRAMSDPRSDIYSLCAVFYYALTGKKPKDSLERTLDDDLQPVKELMPGTDPAIDRLVMKGMAMDPGERWKDIEEIEAVIGQYKKSEEEREKEAEHRRRLQKRRKIASLIGFPVCLVLIILIFVHTNWKLIKFRGAETQSLAIYYDQEMKEKEIEELKAGIKQKTEDIAGSRGYILRQKPGLFEITVEYEPLKEIEIPVLMNKYFLSDQCDFLELDNNGVLRGLWERINGSDRIESIAEEGSGIRISISDQFLKELMGQKTGTDASFYLRLHPGEDSFLMWDRNNTPYDSERYDFEAEINFKEKSIIITDPEFEDTVSRKLLMDCLSSDSVAAASSFNYSRRITWENRSSLTWGKSQVEHSELLGKTVLFSYKDPYAEPSAMNILEEIVSDEDLESSDAIHLKERLDSLKIPYACGWDADRHSELYILLEAESVWEFEAALLTMNADSEFITIKTPSGILAGQIDLDVPLTAEKGKIKVKLINGDIINDLETGGRRAAFEEGMLQLCIGSRPCFQTAVHEMPEDGWIVFDEILLGNTGTEKIENRISDFVDFINVIIRQKDYFLDEKFQGALMLSPGEVPFWQEDMWDLGGCENTEMREQIMELADEYKLRASWSASQPETVRIFCVYDQEKKEKYKHPFQLASEFLNKLEMSNEVQKIYFEFADRDYNSLIGEYELTAVRNEWTGRHQVQWWHYFLSVGSGYSGAEDHPEYDSYDATIRYLAEDEFYRSVYLIPAVNKKYKDSIIEEEGYSLKLSMAETLPGEEYLFNYTITNKTDEEMTVTYPLLSINGVMTGRFGSVHGQGKIIIDPHSEIERSLTLSADELHYSLVHSPDSVMAEFKIRCYDQEIYKRLELTDTGKRREWDWLNGLLPKDRQIASSDLYTVYNLTYRDYTQYLLIRNHTDHTLVMDFKRMGTDGEWNSSFEPVTVRILPGALIFTELNNYDTDRTGTEETFTVSVEAEAYTEDEKREKGPVIRNVLFAEYP